MRNIAILAAIVLLAAFLGFVLSNVSFETENPILPGLAFALDGPDYHVQAYVVLLLLATALFVFFIIPRVAAEDGGWLLRLLTLAFFFKIGVGLFRLFWMWSEKGGADSELYFNTGATLAPQLWQMDFSFVPELAQAGTQFMRLYATFVMGLIGPTLPGVFLVFGLFSFTAAILYYKSFCIVFPNANRKLFAALIFFFPSWAYWPSSVGKDAIVALFIAVCLYGLARFIGRRSAGGLVILAIGMLAAATIRPHIAGALAVAMAVPMVMRLPTGPRSITPVLRVLYVSLIAVSAWVVVDYAAESLHIEDLSVAAAADRYDALAARGERGGSGFEPTTITEPLGVPMAFVTVLFRPFPWEAPHAAALVLSFEGVVFAGVVLWRLSALKRAVASIFSNPYVMFLVVYVILMVLAFSVLGNFSLLGRQRLMALPAFFMLISFATAAEERKNAEVPAGPRRTPAARRASRTPVRAGAG